VGGKAWRISADKRDVETMIKEYLEQLKRLPVSRKAERKVLLGTLSEMLVNAMADDLMFRPKVVNETRLKELVVELLYPPFSP